MVTLKVLKDFTIDGNLMEKGRVFTADEARAYILVHRTDGACEVVPGTEEEIFGTGTMKGAEHQVTPIEVAAGVVEKGDELKDPEPPTPAPEKKSKKSK